MVINEGVVLYIIVLSVQKLCYNQKTKKYSVFSLAECEFAQSYVICSLIDRCQTKYSGRVCQANRCCSCEEQGQWWESVNQTADFLKTLADLTLLMWLCWLRILINHGESLVLTNERVAEACVIEAYKKICLGYREEEGEAKPIWSFTICISFNIALYSVETDHYQFLTKL